jgi:putative ABC transport system substrate-binding protein
LKITKMNQGGAPTLAAKQATAVIPTVFAAVSDPVGTGVVAGLARPGGNITGLANQVSDTAGKKLELLRELVPGLHRLAIMAHVAKHSWVRFWFGAELHCQPLEDRDSVIVNAKDII